MSKIKSILISGWFGEENLGDELILKGSIEMIKEINPNIIINVMGTKPQKIKKDHVDINRVSTTIDHTLKSKIRLFKYNPINVYRNIKYSDALILSSGGALSDWNITSTNNLFYMIDKFKKKNKPIFMLACGAGPIIRNESKKIFYEKLKDIEKITLRDITSYDELESIKLKNIKLTNDIVFDLKLNKNYNYINKFKRKKIGIVISSLSMNKEKENNYVNDLIKYIKMLKENEFQITLIPFQYNEDIEIMNKISQMSGVSVFEEGKDDMWKLIKVLQEQDVVIGSRFHCVVTCIIFGIPIIPIIYHHKVYCLVEQFGLLQFAENIGDGSNWKNENINIERMYKNTIYVYNNAETISNNISNLNSKINEHRNGINKKLLKEFIEK